jgi:hypothetical protein
MRTREKILTTLVFMIFTVICGQTPMSAQTEISVPIPEGWIGAVGSAILKEYHEQ